MNRFRVVFGCVALFSCVVSAAPVRAQGVVYESAELGRTGIASGVIVSSHWYGTRFELEARHELTAAGAHILGGGEVFVAIFALQDSMPPSPPDLADALCRTVLRPYPESIDARGPLNDCVVDPGAYALVIGRNGGGVFNWAALPTNNSEVGTPEYIRRDYSTNEWQNAPTLEDLRFVVEGIEIVPGCGNGHLEDEEDCDDAGETATCDIDCTTVACGDGVSNEAAGEECDDGNASNMDRCLTTCELTVCGDDFVQTDVEECDNGEGNSNTIPNACRENCIPAHCGDGIVDRNEPCDDGNIDNTDECLNTCELPYCGDGYVNREGEECDDADRDQNDGCLNTCKAATCGDGLVLTGVEACDDGNRVNDDACTNDCARPSCGNGIVDPEEDCDDGNSSNADSCLNTCLTAFCGDGKLHATLEQCDDGNAEDGDGCSSGCLDEDEPQLREVDVSTSSKGCSIGRGGSTDVFLALLAMALVTLRRRFHARGGR